MNVGRGNPCPVDFVLKSRLRPVEVHRQVQRQDKGQQRNDQGKDPDVAITPRQQHAASSAPASGMKVTSDRMIGLQSVHASSCAHPDHVSDHCGRSRCHPSGIGAQVAGLHVTDRIGNFVGAMGAVVDEWRQSRPDRFRATESGQSRRSAALRTRSRTIRRRNTCGPPPDRGHPGSPAICCGNCGSR